MLPCPAEVLYCDVGHRAGDAVREIAEGLQPEVHLVSRVEVRDDGAVAPGDGAVRVRRRLGEHCGVGGVVYLQCVSGRGRAGYPQLDAIGSALDDFEPVGVAVGVRHLREVGRPSVDSGLDAVKQHVQRAVPRRPRIVRVIVGAGRAPRLLAELPDRKSRLLNRILYKLRSSYLRRTSP